MKSIHLFKIPFKGLKVGKHDFDFDTDDSFFADFESSEISKGKVHAHVLLDKKTTMLELQFELKGVVTITCDRCLEEFEMPIEYETSMYVKFGEETEEQTDEILVLSQNEFELDVSQYIYEYIHLSLPHRKVHPTNARGKSTCNKEMLKKLDEYLVRGNDGETDPRWNELKNLMNNN